MNGEVKKHSKKMKIRQKQPNQRLWKYSYLNIYVKSSFIVQQIIVHKTANTWLLSFHKSFIYICMLVVIFAR